MLFNPDVSIIMPMYNGERFIKDSFASAYDRSFKGNAELVVVNDGSTDKSLYYAYKLKRELGRSDFRIRIFDQDNRGIARTKHAAAQESLADVVLMLDQDDLLLDGSLASSLQALESDPSCAIAYSDHLVVDGRGDLIRRSSKRAYDAVDFLTGFPLGHLKAFRRDVLLEHYPAVLDYGVAEDFALCSSIVFSGYGIAHVPRVNYVYRVADHNVTSSSEGLERQYSEAMGIIKQNFSSLGAHNVFFRDPPVRYAAPDAFTHYLGREDALVLLGAAGVPVGSYRPLLMGTYD